MCSKNCDVLPYHAFVFCRPGTPRVRQKEKKSQSGFDLSKYISFELRRGDEDSAPAEKLGFFATVSKLENDQMKFSLEFENPLMVSIGSRKDQIVGIVQDESFFTSQDSGLSIAKGKEIKTFLPKLLPGA